MINKIKNTNCYIVLINSNVNHILDEIYNNFQVLDEVTDDLKIIDHNKNEIDINLNNELLLLNNKIDTNIFTYEQLSIIKKLEKLTKVRLLTNVNVKYWV